MAVVSALRKATPKVTLGGTADAMRVIRDSRRELAAEDKLLVASYEALEATLLSLMDSEGTTKCEGKSAGASIGESDSFNFDQSTDAAGDDGFTRFMKYVAKQKYYHLVQRRISAPAVREIFASKGVVPGLVPYVKRVINLRNL